MIPACMRCGESIGENDRFCSACGMPQLVCQQDEAVDSSAAERQSEPSGLGVSVLVGTTSETGISWRIALNAAILLGIPAGLLCSGLSTIGQSLSILWMLAAAAWAVVLYGRRARSGWITMGMGARIGLVTGLVAAWLTLFVNGIALWLQRFPLHQGAQMDSEWSLLVARLMDQVTEINHQMAAQPGFSSADAAQMAHFWSALLQSPQGRAGFMLFAFLFAAIFLLLFAVLGGMLGTRLLPAERRRPRV